MTYMTNIVVNENTSREEIVTALEAAFAAGDVGAQGQVVAKVGFDFQVNSNSVSDKHGAVGTTVALSSTQETSVRDQSDEGVSETYTNFKFIIQGTRAGTEWHRSGKFKSAATTDELFKKAAADVLGSFKRATVKTAVTVVDHDASKASEAV